MSVSVTMVDAVIPAIIPMEASTVNAQMGTI